MTTTPACAITLPLQLLSVQADQTAPYPQLEIPSNRALTRPGATSGASIYSRKNGKAYQINQAITTYQRR